MSTSESPPIEAYLDWAASAPIRPAALDAMVQAAQTCYANPTGAHKQARKARRVVDEAREIVADALGGQPAEVVFCSGGTESDNLAVFGAQRAHGGVPMCSAIEHHAVLHPVEALEGVVLPVDAAGVLDLDAFSAALTANADGAGVSVVSVMLANNETGMIQPLGAVAELMDTHAPTAALHTDAVQGFVWLDVADHAQRAHLVSITGHKFGGPNGVGALLIRRGTTISPQTIGGGQEFEVRAGTQNVAGIAGFAAAVQETVKEREQTNARVAQLRDHLVDGLLELVPGAVETGDRERKVAGSAHLIFAGIESEALLFLLERKGVYASAASSCASGAQEPSHVLAAMGVHRDDAQGSLRLSLGRDTTAEEVDRALAVIPPAVNQLLTRTAGGR